MSKSAIYTTNTSNASIAVDGIIAPGAIVRRFGCNVNLSGDGIRIAGPGYYKVNASFTVAPSDAGTTIITAYKDGVVIQGAVAQEIAAAANDPINLSLVFLVRENCPCCDDSSNITFVLSGVAANNLNTAIVVEKI